MTLLPLCPTCLASIGGAHGGPDAEVRPCRPGEPCGAADHATIARPVAPLVGTRVRLTDPRGGEVVGLVVDRRMDGDGFDLHADDPDVDDATFDAGEDGRWYEANDAQTGWTLSTVDGSTLCRTCGRSLESGLGACLPCSIAGRAP